MSAQPEHPADSRVHSIPHTINAIGDALTGGPRARFYGEVLAAEEADVPGVMRRWWREAMLNSARGAETSRANVTAGRNLVAVEDLLEQVERAAG
ncbi:hypothetical protein AB0D74_49140 [Streptomyces sp. NPDC048278]|uniref:hypothetical protein n=1 Tax=Streptomyces sp. NPDC048278 TaxID=3155809 RepID=UPI0034435A96